MLSIVKFIFINTSVFFINRIESKMVLDVEDDADSKFLLNNLKYKLEVLLGFEEDSDELKYNELYSAPKIYKPGSPSSLSRNAILSLMG